MGFPLRFRGRSMHLRLSFGGKSLALPFAIRRESGMDSRQNAEAMRQGRFATICSPCNPKPQGAAMAEIVFSHITALEILRCNPDLLEYPRISLPPDFAPLAPSSEEAAAIFHRLTRAAGPDCRFPDNRLPSGHFSDESDPSNWQAPIAHCMLGSGNRRPRSLELAFHQGEKSFSAKAFIKISDSVALACPELAFLQCTRALDETEAMMLAFELCGTYATERSSLIGAEHTGPLTSCAGIRTFISRNQQVNGAKLILRQKILDYAADNSASPRESALALLLSLPASRGGRGLEPPVMNHRIDADETARKISGQSCFYADLCWPHLHIDVEYASRRHHSDPNSRLKDGMREHALRHLGWTVIQVSEADLRNPATLDDIANLIRKASKKRKLKQSVRDYSKKKELEAKLLDTPSRRKWNT